MAKPASIINQLSSIQGLQIECPECGGSFSSKKAQLFSITTAPTPKILKYLLEKKQGLDNQFEDIKAQRAKLKKRKKEKPKAIKVTTAAVNFGKIVEKIIPSFDNFPFDLRDCRALFDPIDYIIFNDLAKKGVVESIIFSDVKSGSAQLQDNQKQIKRLVENGKVRLTVVNNE